jgi:hypothetical protein
MKATAAGGYRLAICYVSPRSGCRAPGMLPPLVAAFRLDANQIKCFREPFDPRCVLGEQLSNAARYSLVFTTASGLS